MQHQRIGCTTLIVLLATAATPLSSNFPVLFLTPPASGQTIDAHKTEADQLLQQSLQQFKSSQFQAALQSAQQALTIYRQIGDRVREGSTLGDIGVIYYHLGQYDRALKFYQQALDIAKQVDSKTGQWITLSDIGQVYLRLGQYDRALKFYQQALDIAKQAANIAQEGKTLSQIGLIYYILGQYSDALKFYQQALIIFKEAGKKVEQGEALTSIGLIYNSLGQYHQALKSFEQALVIVKEVGNKLYEGITLNNIGEVHNSRGQYSQALKLLGQALVIFQEVRDRAGEGTTLTNIGSIYNNLSQYPDALKYYQQALVIHKEVGNKAAEGKTMNNIGVIYDILGQYDRALKFHQQALAIAKEMSDNVEEGTTLNNIGTVYLSRGQYPQALKIFEQALVTVKQVGNKAREAITLNNIGSVYERLGQYSQALKFYQQALVIRREVGDRAGEGRSLNNMGQVYNYLGQYSQALKFYQQALVIFKEIGNKAEEGVTVSNIGATHQRLSQYPQALKRFEQALVIFKEVGNKVEEGTTLNNIGEVYRSLSQLPQALKFYQQALVIAKEVGNREGEGKILSNTGAVYYRLGQYPDAEKTLITAIQALESLRPGLSDTDKISIFETQAHTYRGLQLALVAQNKINTALETAEQGRAKAFVELLASRLFSSSNKLSAVESPTIKQIQQISKQQNATLVEYSIISPSAEKLFIWVIKPSGEIAFRSVDLKNLDTNLTSVAEEGRIAAATDRNRGEGSQNAIFANLVRGTRDSISKGSSNTATNSVVHEATSATRTKNQHLQQLHELLIQPIKDLLPTDPNARVIFIPHESLFLVPFPALQDANGKYLIEKHTILTAPSIQVLDLTHLQRQRVSGKDMLVVGNPTMPIVSSMIGEPPQPLAPLSGAEREAIAIARLLNTKAVTGDRATEAAIKQQMPRARMIHLATHGLLDDFTGAGVPGAIALAPSAKDDGLLTADEILDLKLSAELVVLSACDTGRGNITGDGVIGLSRSLISAGVPSVVVSLWKVLDEPTASLMTEFYRQLQQNPDKATALRQAMLTTMKKHPKPRDWAAFTLIGEAR